MPTKSLIQMTPDELGEYAFNTYREAVGKITFDGKPIPLWAEIGERQKIGWRAAGVAIRDNTAEEMT